jgi:hypothetical protein
MFQLTDGPAMAECWVVPPVHGTRQLGTAAVSSFLWRSTPMSRFHIEGGNWALVIFNQYWRCMQLAANSYFTTLQSSTSDSKWVNWIQELHMGGVSIAAQFVPNFLEWPRLQYDNSSRELEWFGQDCRTLNTVWGMCSVRDEDKPAGIDKRLVFRSTGSAGYRLAQCTHVQNISRMNLVQSCT